MDGKPCITLYLPLQSVKLDGLIPQPISPQSASTSQAGSADSVLDGGATDGV